MARPGKIACLPQSIRAQLNTRLDDGADGRDILAWLRTLPEVKHVLNDRFEGRFITKQNLSDWRQNGFEIWLLQRDILALSAKAANSSQNSPPITLNQAKSK